MRIVIQRVTEAAVRVDGRTVGSVGRGMMVLVGVENGDGEADARWLAEKTAALRIFDDENGVMNLPITAVGGRVLAISQFTLTASTRRGNRPSYIRAARGDEARTLYQYYCDHLSALLNDAGFENDSHAPTPGNAVEQGIFGADMAVSLTNDGPVTIIIDSRLKE